MVWQVFGANTPRFVRPVGGLLIEGQRTNGNANPRCEGVVPGSPGTGPTGWTIPVIDGLTRTISGPTTIDGVEGFAVRYQGTPTATGGYAIICGPSEASDGATVTNSVFLALLAGSMTNITGTQVRNHTSNGSTTWSDVTDTPKRYTATQVTAGNSSTQVRWGFSDTVTPVDFTLWMGWPQRELGASFASTPILPPPGTLAAATRGADIVTAPFASLFPNNELSLLVAAIIGQGAPQTSRQTVVQADAGSDADGWAVLNEPARTNIVANPRHVGAVLGLVGSGGALPNEWTIAGTGVSAEVVAIGTFMGLPAISIRYFAASAPGGGALRQNFKTGVSLVTGGTYAVSVFLAHSGGSLTNVTAARVVIDNEAGGAAFALGASMQRATKAVVATATTANRNPAVTYSVTAGAPIDFTITYAGAQLEAGIFASTPMLPAADTIAAASRDANTLTLTNGFTAENLGTFTPGSLFKVGVTLAGGQLKGLLDGGSLKSMIAPSTPATTVRQGGNVDGSLALFGEIRRSRALAFALGDGDLQPALTALPVLP